MAHIKNLSNRAYISGSLKDKLSRFEMYRYSFIYAPTGYGKSKVIRTFFKNYPGYTVLWIDAESSREIFWDNFCNAVKMFDNTLAAAFKKIGFPDSDYAINEVINLLSIMNSEKFSALLVIDNFDNIFDDNMCRIFAASYLSTAVGLRYAFILKKLTNQSIINLITKDDALGITKKDFAFSQEDIEDYFRLNEIILDKETSKDIFNKTLGWPYVVHLYMEAYKNKHTDADKTLLDKAYTFIENNVWLELSDDERQFLATMSVFSSFNLNQCMKQTFLEEKMCLKLLNSIPLINYDEHTRRYSFNPMFDGFILQVLDEMPVDEVTKITLRAADTNLDDGNYFEAMKLYSHSKEYRKIYQHNINFIDSLTAKNEILSYFKGKVRFELNINTKQQIRQLLNIPNNNIQNVLNATANPILTVIDEAVKYEPQQQKAQTLRDYEHVLLLKDCDYDMVRVEAKVRALSSKNTSITRMMQPYKELYKRLQDNKTNTIDIRALVA